MKKDAKYTGFSTRSVGGCLLAAGMVACGGGGGAPEPAPVLPRFEASVVEGVSQILDRETGITWAGAVGAAGLPQTASLPYATELLSLADGDAAVLSTHFSLLSGKRLATQHTPNSTQQVRWTVDFGVAGDPGSATLALETASPDYDEWYVLNRRTTPMAASFSVNATKGTVTSGNLTWKLCSEGTSLNAVTQDCSTGSPVVLNYASTANYVATANGGSGFAGLKGWRVPTKQELQTLMQWNADLATGGNLLPASFAKDLTYSAVQFLQYWTSSESVDGNYRWQVDFSGGRDGAVRLSPVALNGTAFLRLVRSN